MHSHDLRPWQHEHGYVASDESRAEQRTRWVVGITLAMMVVEIGAGIVTGSMALLSDGWHMATHAAAFGVALFAYWYARRHARDERYTFGTGKVGALGGFASAVGLAVVAIGVGVESVERLTKPEPIDYGPATIVAIVGLLVNLASAWLLGGAHEHHHEHEHDHDHDGHEHEHDGHDHDHGHDHGHDHEGHDHNHEERDHDHDRDHTDHNLRGAYLHVIADALTSVLAIVALLVGQATGWSWLDAITGLVGAVLIGRWSMGLLADTSRVLLDAEAGGGRRRQIVDAIEAGSEDRVVDLHIWRVGPKHLAAIISVLGHGGACAQVYKEKLRQFPDLVHVTVEVLDCPGAT